MYLDTDKNKILAKSKQFFFVFCSETQGWQYGKVRLKFLLRSTVPVRWYGTPFFVMVRVWYVGTVRFKT